MVEHYLASALLQHQVCFVACTGEGGDGSTAHGGYLAKTFEESREFLALKQHLDTQLNVALNEPQDETPQYATNFIWQVSNIYLTG